MKHFSSLFFFIGLLISFASCNPQLEDDSSPFWGSGGNDNSGLLTQGCNEHLARNFEGSVSRDNGSCIFRACTDSSAPHYHSSQNQEILTTFQNYQIEHPRARPLEHDPDLCGNDESDGNNNDGTDGTDGDGTDDSDSTGGVSDAGQGEGCQGQSGSHCLGGYDSDPNPKSLKVKIVYISSPGGNMLGSQSPTSHGTQLINQMNQNYQHNGHKHLVLELDSAQLVSRGSMTETMSYPSQYTEAGKYTIFLVQSFNGMTLNGQTLNDQIVAGFIAHTCARLQNREGWGFASLAGINDGTLEHEVNHSLCFPHTTAANGVEGNAFLHGCNNMTQVLSSWGAYRGAQNSQYRLDNEFKIYVHPHPIPAQDQFVSRECNGMTYNTRNLMYFRVITETRLFTPGSEGFHHSYSHLFDYYYWKFIKPFGAN